jgi:hypothetical protein
MVRKCNHEIYLEKCAFNPAPVFKLINDYPWNKRRQTISNTKDVFVGGMCF